MFNFYFSTYNLCNWIFCLRIGWWVKLANDLHGLKIKVNIFQIMIKNHNFVQFQPVLQYFYVRSGRGFILRWIINMSCLLLYCYIVNALLHRSKPWKRWKLKVQGRIINIFFFLPINYCSSIFHCIVYCQDGERSLWIE